MANTTKTPKTASLAKPAAPKAVKPAKPVAARAPAKVSRAPAPVEAVEPAVLTASQALNAMQAATGETVTAPAKRPYTRKAKPPVAAAPVAAPVAVAEPVVIAPVMADAVPEPTPAAPAEVPVVAAPPVEEPVAAAVEEPAPLLAEAEGTLVMTDVIQTTKKFAEDAKAKFESAFADINLKAKAGVEKSTKAIGELSDLTKGNVEAFVESGKIAAKGVEVMGQDAAEYGRKSFEKATASMKSFASVKSPTEFFQLQSELMSGAFDAFAKETAKNSEAMLKLAGEVAQPISSRVSLVTEKVKSLAA